jgi:hypothetical protein
VELKAFDLVVQRGANHAWTNLGTETALLLTALSTWLSGVLLPVAVRSIIFGASP